MRLLGVSGGRIQIKDTDGAVRFDTYDKLFHITDAVSGSLSISALVGGSDTVIDTTTSFNLGSCNSSCTHVVGALKFTLNSYAAGMAFDRWHTFLGGAAMWVLDGEPGFAGGLGDNDDGRASQLVYYSLRVTSGVVWLDRRAVIADTDFSYTVLSHSISYKLKTGLFT